MTILVSSTQADLAGGDGLGSAVNELGEAMGIPDLVQPASQPPRGRSSIFSQVEAVASELFSQVEAVASELFNSLRGKSSSETYDQHFVGSGRQVVPGGQIQGGKTSPLEGAAVRRVISQKPAASVLVKKRAFASLNHYYTPSLMDDSELWLFRATKKLFQRKCAAIADYERLAKIRKIADSEDGAQAALMSLVTYFGAQLFETVQDMSLSGQLVGGGDRQTSFFTSAMRLQQIARDREPPEVTTWFSSPDLPILPDLGQGSGVFEITLATGINTNLSIDGSGNCSLTLENPYNILQITDYDIEQAIRETALTNLVEALGSTAANALQAAQQADAALSRSRRERFASAITFSISPSGASKIQAVIDAIGFEIDPDTLDSIPEDYALTSEEQALFRRAYRSLENYSKAVSSQRLNGLAVGGRLAGSQLRKLMTYVRRMLRKSYMGKMAIQPMDVVHVFIGGGTRMPGEGEDIEPGRDALSPSGMLSNIEGIVGLQDTQFVDDRLLKVAWQNSGKHLTFSDFKKLNTIDRGDMHVFAGLVRQATNRFTAEQGRYEMSVSADSTMEWLKLSRYNKEPSLNQTQGIVYDPLTPFDFETDPATGIPVGKARLSDVNQRLLQSRPIYAQRGRNRGERLRTLSDLEQDAILIGGRLTPIFEMPPGLKYRWKEGVVTHTYNTATINPLDRTKANAAQLHRDIGFFASNTVWDSMDAANIVSVLVTGQPYNPVTFIQSAVNTGAFTLDTTLNSGIDYFHSLFETQQSLNRVQGNFSPFKHISTDRRMLAMALATQQRLTNRSALLQQLRGEYAKLQDRKLSLEQAHSIGSGQEQAPKSFQYSASKRAIEAQQAELQTRLDAANKEFSELLKDAKESVGSIVRIAGDDITFSFSDPDSNQEAQLFGDSLLFVTQRRREDVIRNQDPNYLIVAEEYDKDYDIQAFALQLRRQSPEMWKSSWSAPYELCQRAAEMLDFEFFVNTQGHIEFRPPRYNRTPLSVMQAMLALNKTAGVRVFPEFLEKLFSRRAESIIDDVLVAEWEIRRQAALLGLKTQEEIGVLVGEPSISFLHMAGDIGRAVGQQRPLDPQQQQTLRTFLARLDQSEAQSETYGLFSAQEQLAGHQLISGRSSPGARNAQSEYEKAVDQLVQLTGNLKSDYPPFDQAKVGARRNGQSTPAQDVSAIIDRISTQISRRARLLRSLDSVLSQSVEIARLNEDGSIDLGIGSLTTKMFPGGFFERLVEDDTKHVLGHLSGRRFIIDDDVLLGYSFIESPPQTTHWRVAGTDPIVGERGGNISGGYPLYIAISVDFDLVRQYGFRSEKMVEKPMFWSAEQQCAPYARMLLTRERKDLVRVNAQIVGNEYYQLGDVVYVSDLQMLFYVYGVSHSFSYEEGFSTTLDLRYGHPPGEYIPTPLDLIGKGLSNRSGAQGAYRTRRQRPPSDVLLAAVKFPPGGYDAQDLLGGSHGERNFRMLVNALTRASTELDKSDPSSEISPHLVVLAFGDSGNESLQLARLETVRDWLVSPQAPGAVSDALPAGTPEKTLAPADQIARHKVPAKLIDLERLAQFLPLDQLSDTDRRLLRNGITASEDSWLLDDTLDTIVEVRLRRPPVGGWSAEEE